MSLSLIRAEYKTILESVTGIGKVHDYSRLATDWKVFLDLFKDPSSETILGWEISREASPEERLHLSGASPGSVSDRKHIMLIRGYSSLQDATGTQKTFDNLIEAICDKFRPLITLNDVALKVETPMIVSVVTEREFGGVLCHYAELRQAVWDRLTF